MRCIMCFRSNNIVDRLLDKWPFASGIFLNIIDLQARTDEALVFMSAMTKREQSSPDCVKRVECNVSSTKKAAGYT